MTNEDKEILKTWIHGEVKNSCINTLGYIESQNKEDYLKGISFAANKTVDLMMNRVRDLERKLERISYNAIEYKNDLETLSNILNKYKKYE